MSEQRKNRIGWVVSLVGFVITLGSILFGGEVIIESPPPRSELREPQSHFAIPKPEPRDESWDFSQPFLFQLAGTDKMTGMEREKKALLRYHELLTQLDGVTMPEISVSTKGGIAVVMVNGQPFLTVMQQDCPEYFSRLDDEGKLALQEEVAYAWARALEEDLMMESVKRLPQYLTLFNRIALLLFFVVCLAHLTLNAISRRVRRPLWSGKILLWLLYFTLLTALHPSLGSITHVLTQGALNPVFDFVLIGVGVAVLHQLTHLVLRRYLAALASFEDDRSLRAEQRRHTLEQAWLFVSKATWSFLGLCVFLSDQGVDLAQFFAGAGLIGVVIGLMARDMFMDFFNGIYILTEDQFGVGDWIESNQDYGQVISFSLRSTKLRRTDGGLTTIPNSDLRRARNYSNEYSMVDYRVAISYRADTERGLAVLMEEAALLEDDCPGQLLAPPERLGVQELGPNGVVLRIKVRTIPGVHLAMQRLLNGRVKKRFDQEGIRFAGEHSFLEVRMLEPGQDPYAPLPQNLILPASSQGKKSEPGEERRPEPQGEGKSRDQGEGGEPRARGGAPNPGGSLNPG